MIKKKFEFEALFEKIRQDMGITEDGVFEPEPLIETDLENLNYEEIEVLPDVIETGDDDTFEYKGNKVLVYIKNQVYSSQEKCNNAIQNGVSDWKFHITECITLRGFRTIGTFQNKFVVTRKVDGKLNVNMYLFHQLIHENQAMTLYVCKNCLSKINYKNYRNDRKNRQNVYENFSRKEYFELYDSNISTLNLNSEVAAPLNVYRDDHEEFARRLKQKANYICQDCGRDCSQNKKNFHLHHINKIKSDYNLKNLKVICKSCHKRYHRHMTKL